MQKARVLQLSSAVKNWLLLFSLLCLSLVRGQAAGATAILDVVPALSELGADWTTNATVTILDPLSRPARHPGHAPSKGMTNVFAAKAAAKDQMGWGRFHFGRGNLLLNQGAYFVSIQRWDRTNTLNTAWTGWQSRPDYTPWRGAPIGESCFWTEDAKFHGFTFRRGLFHVVITCGAQSDHAGLFRLAEVIDAKISGKSIPKPEQTPP